MSRTWVFSIFHSLAPRLAASPLAPLARRLVARVAGGRPRVVRVLTGTARGLRMELELDRERAYWLGHHEPEVQDFFRAWVRPGAVVYDVGAEIGFLSLCAGALGARVFAFEPAPENVARLRRNAALNDVDVEVVEAAVWENDEGVSLVPGDSGREWRSLPQGTVPSVSLDTFAHDHPAPDVLKIDVEGAEGRVLAGARRLLADRPPLVVCELHGEEERREVTRLLAEFELAELGSEWRVTAFPRGRPGSLSSSARA